MIVPGGGLSLGWIPLDRVSARFLPAGARYSRRLFRRLFLAGRCWRNAFSAPGRPPAVLRRSRYANRADTADRSHAYLGRTAQGRVGWSTPRRPFGGPEAVLRLSVGRYTASRRHLQQPAGRCRLPTRQRRHLQMEGLPDRRTSALQIDDARHGRVHSPLPDARAAKGLPPHPPLRAAGQ